MAAGGHGYSSTSLQELELLERNRSGIGPEKFQQTIYKALECPVCLEIAVPPVTNCKTGHFICGICRKKLEKCVICRNAYTESRNYGIEDLVAKITVPCRNKPCKIPLIPTKVDSHFCEHRSVVCNITFRSGTLGHNKLFHFDRYEEYLDFLAQAHQEGEIPARNLPKVRYVVDGMTFILNMMIEDSIVHAWISAIANPETMTYRACVHVRQMIVDGKVHSKGKSVRCWPMTILSEGQTLDEIKGTNMENCCIFPATLMIGIKSTDPDFILPFRSQFSIEVNLYKPTCSSDLVGN